MNIESPAMSAVLAKDVTVPPGLLRMGDEDPGDRPIFGFKPSETVEIKSVRYRKQAAAHS